MKLPNVGLYNFPFKKCNAPTIVSYVGKSREETRAMTKYLDGQAKKNSSIFAVELSLACPNDSGCPSCYKVGSGDSDPLRYLEIARDSTSLPIIAKIGYFPEEDRLIEFAKNAENIGINGMTAINSPPGMGVDVEKRRSVVKKYGGVFGRGLKPLALRTVNIIHENTNLDTLHVGGIYKYSDAIEALMAGAKAVELSSKLINVVKSNGVWQESITSEPWQIFLKDVRCNTENFMKRKGYKSLEEVIGKLEKQ